MTAIKTVLEAFQGQIRACQQLGSPFTARLLEILTAELTAGGVLSELVGDWPGIPPRMPCRCVWPVPCMPWS